MPARRLVEQVLQVPPREASVPRFVQAHAVDVVRVVFFGYAVYLTWAMMQKMGNYKMTIVELPMNTVYAVCMFGFACACARSVQVLVIHWRQGFSVLERPEAALDGEI